MKISTAIFPVMLLAAGLFTCSCRDESRITSFEENFVTPPNEARPRVWWHWMDGNISKDGALKDIEWMHRVGVGGFHCFDAGISAPQIVDHRVKYMSDEWKDVFSASVAKADKYGMEVGVAASPGWSETGGPWVSPENAMKKIVWSETDVMGGSTFEGILPHPPVVNGFFQDIADGGWQKETFYKDIAVVAFKVKSPSMASLNPKLTYSGGDFTLEQLTNGQLTDESQLPYLPEGRGAWVQYEFDEPQTIYGADIKCGIADGELQRFMLQGEDGTVLEYSNDGVNYEPVSLLGVKVCNHATLSFTPAKGRFFRLRLTNEEEALEKYYSRGKSRAWCPPSPGRKSVPLAEFNLYGTPRVGRYIEKAGFFPAEDLYKCPSEPADIVCLPSEVVDLSGLLAPDGSLKWTAPEGCWKILRFGCSLTGRHNAPASAEATGLEVDKMDAEAVKSYIEHYLSIYKDAAGGLMGELGIKSIMLDSWEVGCQNWTDKMPEEFKKECGYDITCWLPAIAGYVIDSPENSDRFLWDFRKTIAELIAKNHYDTLAEIFERHGLESYMESQEFARHYVADGMRVKKKASIPMCAMWTAPPGHFLALGVSGADCRESASVAHLYGKKYVSAESLTTGDPVWSSYPEKLKERADLLLANGLNRFIIHESCHQPLDDFKPGFTLGIFGQWFNRHETWAEQAKAWTDYLARSCYLLQQGNFVADILYYYGEDNNLTNLYPYALPEIPEGYNFDFVNADAVINDLRVSRGAIVSPSGNRYKIIFMDANASMMSLPVLESLSKLVLEGAVLVGKKPVGTPSLSDNRDEFRSLADAMWNGIKYGKGRVLDCSINDALSECDCPKDVMMTEGDMEYKFVHRKLDDIHIYWLDNRTSESKDAEFSFNVTGLEPQLWNAIDGSISPVSYRMEGDRTKVRIHFDADDAFFIVFSGKAPVKCFDIPAPVVTNIPVEGSWTLSFPCGMGAPEELVLDALVDWSTDCNPYIRYYSGTGNYQKTFDITQDLSDMKIVLNLGSVKNIADVTVNGTKIGTVWKEPWSIDISSAIRSGENTLEITVANLWANRLIGDARGDAGKFAFYAYKSRGAEESLNPSGLLGPVSLSLIPCN